MYKTLKVKRNNVNEWKKLVKYLQSKYWIKATGSNGYVMNTNVHCTPKKNIGVIQIWYNENLIKFNDAEFIEDVKKFTEPVEWIE